MRLLVPAVVLASLACSSCRPAVSGPLMRPPTAGEAPIPAMIIQTGFGYIAHVHRPASLRDGQRLPAVVLIGGSGGGIGWQDYMAELLTARGMVAMSVAYFALDSLPKELDRIPLEGFDSALAWLGRQRYVDPSRVGIGGVSKGAEAALLVASSHPELRAVGVFSPSGIVFQSVTADFRKTSSWTRHGVEMPYIAYGTAPRGSPLVAYYHAGISAATAAGVIAATIPVERITAPLLLLSGRDDTLWGSGELAERIVARLKAESFGPPVESVVYPGAGHLISSIRDDDVTNRGGTREGNNAAQVDGQRRFLDFFARTLQAR